jgi:purine-binding chemotaxis protein CheW
MSIVTSIQGPDRVAPNSSPVEALSGARQFVTFHILEDVFGVPLGEVQEIIRMPELVAVPLSPPALEGIANLRGAVLPITSLRRVFGTRDAPHDDATRVVVVNQGGSPVGFVVDRMASVVHAEADEIEGAGALEGTMRSEMLQGVIKRAGGMIMLLDPQLLAVVDRGAAGRRGASLSAAAVLAGKEVRAADGTTDEIQLVSFEAGGQEYAFPIEDVQEIVQVPQHITTVPQAQAQVVGVMSLRDRLLPLVSLRRMFGLPDAPVDGQSRILVVSPNGRTGGRDAASVGIVMDTVKEVLRVNRALVDAVPSLLAGGNGGPNEFEAICRLDGGKRLVTILSAKRMFRSAALREEIAIAASEGVTGSDEMLEQDAIGAVATTGGTDDEEQFVVFKLASEEYGVPIEAVQEIVRVPEELTHLPKVASFMEGVINLRGMVLPVIDQRRRFALEEAERNDRQRIMVLTIGETRTGFIVDQVLEVLKIARAAIEPAPTLSDEQARLIRRVANLERQKRMILLLDAPALLGAGGG